ncbi:MAG: class I SAM-dependent methyltransferase [Candidatus Omnitrophica bacterium]|nr:class I SAM-dependent methyltransferase [Candidatus Omnitrophota bacterium]
MDIIGQETLERLSQIDAYGQWQYRAIRPFLGRRVMEIGSGIGNISAFLLAGRERVVLTDISNNYLSTLKQRFAAKSEVRIGAFDLDTGQPSYRDENINSIVCMNVLEHIQDDARALEYLKDTLVPGGRLALLVPAHPTLFGTLDEALGHFRRYSKQELSEKITAAGFTLEKIFFFNRAGIFGWWLNGRVLQKKILPFGQLGLFGKLVPVLEKLDPLFSFPFGLSLIAVARK